MDLVRRLAILLALTTSAALTSPVVAEFTFDFGRWPYPLHAEVAARLKELAARYPVLARTHRIGTSSEGRDLWVIEVTNANTGPGESKPALWMDGNIHASEVTGRQLLLYFVERLLISHGTDPQATRLVDTRTFYVMPMLDVDGGERVLTRHPAWPGHNPREQLGKDLDADGYITQMRVRDPGGEWYQSRRDPRVMLRVLDDTGGRWTRVPECIGQAAEAAPPEQRYQIYIEGPGAEPEGGIDSLHFGVDAKANAREPANFNRNWSAEWKPEQPGAGPFPFSLPEVRAVAQFITSHPNIFFHETIHSGGTTKNYIVRPPMGHPYEFMPPEDNDFYTRIGALWSAASDGYLMFSDYYSQENHPGSYGQTERGFSNDWAYMHGGMHSILPEIGAAGGEDYDGDGYRTVFEVMRWNDEQKGGRYFASWTPYDHPLLGRVEIGGPRGVPQGVDARLQRECEDHYRLLTRIAEMSPLVRIDTVTSGGNADGTYRVVATVRNEGFLSTYVTRQAQQARLDRPVMAHLTLEGGEIVGGEATKRIGHILGPIAYVRRWGFGADESARQVEWTIRLKGASPVRARVEVWANRGGRDERTVVVGQKSEALLPSTGREP